MSGPKRRDEAEGGVAVEEQTQTRTRTRRPRMYRVLLHNDDYTTMEFVVAVLVHVFHHSEAAAQDIMLHIHQKGVGVAGVYSFEVAETKVAQTMQLAEQAEYPLLCTLEPDDEHNDEGGADR